MKRLILFRGKCAFTGVWRYGYFYNSNGNSIIRDDKNCESIVIPETVGQFTGKAQSDNHPMFDDSVKLWEDDVFMIEKLKTKYKVVFENFQWTGVSDEGDDWGKYKYSLSAIGKSCIRIIGNIHDNPELL